MAGLLACTLSAARDAETGSPAAGAAARQALCSFKAEDGAEETYVGEVQAANIPATEKVTLMWQVKVLPPVPSAAGLLAQRYAADPRTPANQVPDLVGETISGIVLRTMADRNEGSASEKERSSTDGVTVLRVELKLKSTTG